MKHFVVQYISNSKWVISKGYKLYTYDPITDTKKMFSRLVNRKNGILSAFMLTRRLFRAEITHLYHFQNDTWMCIAKKGIFKYNNNSKLFEKC